MERISKMEMQIKDVDSEMSKETRIYNYTFIKNSEELIRCQNGLDVFQFTLTFTRCSDATSYLALPNIEVANTLTIDPAFDQNTMCKHNHEHLRPGQMDWDTFKCL